MVFYRNKNLALDAGLYTNQVGGRLAMKCAYCGEAFTREATKKTIRGKHFIFCSETCYRFHHYRIPKHDTKLVEGPGTVRIHGVPDFRVLIAEDEKKEMQR